MMIEKTIEKTVEAPINKSTLRGRFADKVQSWRQNLPEFFTTSALSASLRLATKSVLPTVGIHGFSLLIAAGAVTGCGSAIVREYLNQRKEVEKDLDGGNIFTREIGRLRLVNKSKLAKAALRGTIMGAAGAIFGWAVTDLFITIDEVWLHRPLPYTNILGLKPHLAQTAIVADHQAASLTQPFISELPASQADLSPTTIDSQTLGPPSSPALQPDISRQDLENFTQNVIHESTANRIISLPENISLPEGSNTWEEVSKYLKNAWGRDASNNEIQMVAQAVSKKSNILVVTADWGITGGKYRDDSLKAGFNLVFDKSVKDLIIQLANK